MSFLDNLENSLKSLESLEEKDGSERRRKDDDRARTLAIAPWAEKLKTADYTQRLFEQAALAGHRIRAKVYMAWLDSTLRLEARGRKLELRPTPDGIVAAFIEPDTYDAKIQPLDLAGDPEKLLREWLGA